MHQLLQLSSGQGIQVGAHEWCCLDNLMLKPGLQIGQHCLWGILIWAPGDAAPPGLRVLSETEADPRVGAKQQGWVPQQVQQQLNVKDMQRQLGMVPLQSGSMPPQTSWTGECVQASPNDTRLCYEAHHTLLNNCRAQGVKSQHLKFGQRQQLTFSIAVSSFFAVPASTVSSPRVASTGSLMRASAAAPSRGLPAAPCSELPPAAGKPYGSALLSHARAMRSTSSTSALGFGPASSADSLRDPLADPAVAPVTPGTLPSIRVTRAGCSLGRMQLTPMHIRSKPMTAHNYIVKVSATAEILAYLDQTHHPCLGSVGTRQQTDPLTGQAHVMLSFCWWGWKKWHDPLQWLGQLAEPDWLDTHQWWCRMARRLKCCAEERSQRSWLVWLGPLETLPGSRLGLVYISAPKRREEKNQKWFFITPGLHGMTDNWLHYLSGVFQVHAQACQEGRQHAVILQQLVPQSSLHINHANQIWDSPQRLWQFRTQHKPATVLAVTFNAGKNRLRNGDMMAESFHSVRARTEPQGACDDEDRRAHCIDYKTAKQADLMFTIRDSMGTDGAMKRKSAASRSDGAAADDSLPYPLDTQ
ncbi:MAG: hypothetical protein FRX49_03706 [Trebouxia sp. A1-2]|nr:MAG: hypothetical protein FRX49_03706 [Trebouxia sp. A1-2]